VWHAFAAANLGAGGEETGDDIIPYGSLL